MRLLTVTSAGPGTSVTVGSFNFAACPCAAARFLCFTGRASAGVAAAAVAAAGAAATSAIGEATGAGIAGNEFVLFCATATVATINPIVNQQCFFINPKVMF